MATKSALRGASALVMDDNVQIVRLVREILRAAGVRHISEADNGKSGFDALRQHRYDFVIADWNMPEVDGLEFVKMVRESSQSPNIESAGVDADIEYVRPGSTRSAGGRNRRLHRQAFMPADLIRRIEAALDDHAASD